jgi:TP901 family phage tail tape measure protein
MKVTERIEGLSIGLDLDALALDRGLTGLKDKLKTVNSEMKANLSSFDRADKSVEKYESRLQGLNKKLEVQKRVVSASKAEYEKMVREHGEGSKEAEKAARAYNNQVAALNNLERYIGRTSKELQDLQEEQRKASSGWTKLGAVIENTGSTLTDVGDRMNSVGQSMTMYLTAPIVGVGAATVKTAADFEASMDKVAAVSGATGRDFEKLEEQAQELGATTKFSASEAASGMQYLAMAGFDTQEVLSAMPGLLDLAASGALDLGMAADIASNIMSGFTIDASEAGHVSDVLAKAASSANTNVEQLGLAMQYLAPVSNALGWSMEEATSAVMALSDAGLQGEKAGAAFSTSLTRLTSPSKEAAGVIKDLGFEFFTAEGTMRSLPGVIKEIEKGTKGLTQEQKAAAISTVFGQEAYKAWAVLLEKGSGALDKNTKMLEKSDGAAKKMADTMNENTKGSFKEMMSAAEGLAIELGNTLLPIANDVIDTATEWTRKFAELDKETQKNILTLGGLAAAAGPVLMGIGSISTGVGVLAKGVSPLISLMGGGKGLTGILKKIPGPVGLIATGLGVATGAFHLINEAAEKANEVNLKHTDSLIKEQLALEDSVTQYEALRDKLNLSNSELGKYLDLQDKIKLATDPSKVQEYKNAMAELQEKSGLTVDEFKKFVSLDEDIRKNAPETSQKVTEYGNAFIDLNEDLQPVLDKQREFIYNQLQIEKDKAYENLKETADDYLETQENLNGIIEKHNEKLLLQAEYRQKAKDLEDEINQARADGDIATEEHYKREQSMWEEKATNMDSEIAKLYDGFTVEQERLNNLYSRISEESKVYDQLVEQELKMSGINGKASEAINLVDQKVAKLQEEQSALNTNYEKGKITTAEYEEQNSKLNDQISKLKDSRGRIVDIQGEQGEVTNEILQQIEEGGNLNTILDRDHVKDVKIDDNGGAAKLQRETEKGAHKNVNVDDNGDNAKIQRDAEKTANKGVRLSLLNTLDSLISSTISVGVKLLGIGNNADGTRNWRGGLTWVGEEGPELVHLPRGSKVIPNEDSLSLLQKWNVPIADKGFETGGRVTTAGLYPIAEGGWSEWVIPTDPSRRTDAMKLLALAGREIQGNKRPSQLPNVGGADNGYLEKIIDKLSEQVEDTKEIVSLLVKILMKNSSIILDGKEISRGTWEYDQEFQMQAKNDMSRAWGD